MKIKEQILQAVDSLTDNRPYDEITFADIADLVGCHWTTVRRYFGSKDKMRDLLIEMQMKKECTIPDLKTKILDAGSRIFAKNGYDGTSLDQIANNIGLSKGAVYWHFSSKSELYLAICERSLKQLHSNIAGKFRTVFTSSDPSNEIKVLIMSELTSCQAGYGELPRLFLQFVATNNDRAISEKLSQAFTELFSVTADVLKQLQKDNLINRQVDAEALTVGLHALMNGLVLMWLVNPAGVSIANVSNAVSKMIWNGLCPGQNESRQIMQQI